MNSQNNSKRFAPFLTKYFSFATAVVFAFSLLVGCEKKTPEKKDDSAADNEGIKIPWREDYTVYNPEIVKATVYDPAKGQLKYNHDASIEYFQGSYIAVWNGNESIWEGKPGQLNYWAYSKDGVNWSKPIPFGKLPLFGNPNWQTEWQPNLLVYSENELWCLWSKSGAFIFSIMRDINEGWEHRVVFESIDIDGEKMYVFPSQNPIKLQDGSVIAPVVLRPPSPVSPDSLGAAVAPLRTRDGGQTWVLPPGSVVRHPEPTLGVAQQVWEPMYVVQKDGNVRMFMRNEDRSASADKLLLTAVGNAEAEYFSPAEYSEIETIISRPWVGRANDRWLMLHHDSLGTFFSFDRINIALFVSPTGEDNFIPGIPLVDDEFNISYPQAMIKDDQLTAIYTSGGVPRAIKTVTVNPLPQEGESYIYPRSPRRAIAEKAKPLVRSEPFNEIEFYGTHELISTSKNAIASSPVSFAAWVRIQPHGQGILLNALSSDGEKGFAIRSGWHNDLILILGTELIELRQVYLPQNNTYQFVAISLDPTTGEILYWKNNEWMRSRVALLEGADLGTEPIRFATPNNFSSIQKLANPFYGGIHSAFLFEGLLTEDQVRALYNEGAAELRIDVLTGEVTDPPSTLASLTVDTVRDPKAFLDNDHPLSASTSTSNGNLKVHGNASASVEIDAYEPGSDTLEVCFSAQINLDAGKICLLTLAGREPFRLFADSSGYLQLQRGDNTIEQLAISFNNGEMSEICVTFHPDVIELSTPHAKQKSDGGASGRRLFLGDAMPISFSDPANSVTFEVSKLKTRVHPATNHP